MQSATLLKAENKTLWAANEKVRKKLAKKCSYVGRGGILTSAEALGSCAPAAIEAGVEIVPVELIVAPRAQRAPHLCSICRSPSHTARSCSEC